MKSTHLNFEEKYQVVVDKDISYEGVFYTAVKTTGIFCRPGCSARLPKRENVIFYNTINEAIANGFRPCKVCKPMELSSQTPEYVSDILSELEDKPYLKIKDYDLIRRGIEPNKMRRWFKNHYNMTFQAYQRMLRINTAFKRITDGESVTGTAYDIGFDSISGFNNSYKNVFGKSAKSGNNNTVINIVRFTTPLGPMFACASTNGICLLEFTNRRMLETEFRDLAKRMNAVILPGPNAHLDKLEQELSAYFKGTLKKFTVALDAPGTSFQKKVWEILGEIPYGETWSYQQQSEKLKNLKAVRAVASANGHNRIAIIIPCHRVIGKDGKLTGYGGGLERKRWLLEFERKHSPKRKEELALF